MSSISKPLSKLLGWGWLPME